MPLSADRPREPGGTIPPAPGRFRPLVALIAVAFLLAGRALPPVSAAEPDSTHVMMADHALVFDTNLGLIQRATEEAIDRALTGCRSPRSRRSGSSR